MEVIRYQEKTVIQPNPIQSTHSTDGPDGSNPCPTLHHPVEKNCMKSHRESVELKQYKACRRLPVESMQVMQPAASHCEQVFKFKLCMDLDEIIP